MTKYTFHKYHGTGNDFVLIDDRSKDFPLETTDIKKICDRHFGIGADGFMLLQPDEDGHDFRMIYYNSDGNQSSMCGNGGRCISSFAKSLGIQDEEVQFSAIDGVHRAQFLSNGLVRLEMNDVTYWEELGDAIFMDTGSPHFVQFVDEDLFAMDDFVKRAAEIRYSDRFNEEGTNVNFIERRATDFYLRTYERGVEDETLSCGTGTVASALTIALKQHLTGTQRIELNVKGGKLQVEFNQSENQFREVSLIGPTQHVFKGVIDLSRFEKS